MDQDTIADLKQFITSTISQQLALQSDDLKKELKKEIVGDITSSLGTRMDRLEERIDYVDTKLDTIANTIGVRMEEDKTSVHEILENHETRITRLEQKPA